MILPTIESKSFDVAIIDPPYGMGIDDWDQPLSPDDIAFYTSEVKRICREFYAVFGQMPYLREWDNEATKQGLTFLDHISWIKRNNTPSKRISRGHEEIYIYSLNGKKEFYQIQGRFEDVKIPCLVIFTTFPTRSDRKHRDPFNAEG